MRRIYWLIGILFFTILASYNYTMAVDWKEVSKQIHCRSKSIRSTSGSEDIVIADGRWKIVASKISLSTVAIINTTSIICDKRRKTCQENIAMLYTPEDHPEGSDLSFLPILMVSVSNYNVIDWSGSIIRAKCEEHVADIELRISVKDNFAERSFRETKSRGSETSDPHIFQSWILE